MSRISRFDAPLGHATAHDEALLRRQPILDRKNELFGYELTLQSSAPRAHAATLICTVYAELGIGSALGHNLSFLRVDTRLLLDDAVEALPADAVVLELIVDAPPDELTVERCRTLRERGYKLALGGYRGLDAYSAPLLSLADFVKIDIGGLDDMALYELAGPLSRLPIKLLAKGVHTPGDMTRCQTIGFQLFQGLYFARAETVSQRRLSASQANLIELINLATRDSETSRIEDTIKRDPALSISLLRIVNSVAFGLSRPINSPRNAITLLGRRQLQRWLQLLLMAPPGTSPDVSRSPLLQLAALRGRLMERLVELAGPPDNRYADQAFITGIMSMMPAALALPMDEILAQIALDDEIRHALSSRSGTLGRMLELVDAFDAEDGDACDALLDELARPAINRAALNNCLVEALRWINGHGHLT